VIRAAGRGKQGFDPVVLLEDAAQSFRRGVVPLNGCRDGVRRYQCGKLGVFFQGVFRFVLKIKADAAYWLPFGDVHRHKRNLDPGSPAGVFESVRDVLHLSVQPFKLCGQGFPLVRVGVADRFGVEQTADFAAVLHHVQSLEKMGGPGGKRRVHHDCGIFRGGAEGQEVVMHHPETVLFELGAEVAGKLDAVKLEVLCPFRAAAIQFPGLAVVVDVGGGVDSPGKCPIPGGRFQDGHGQGVVFPFPQGVDHLPCQIVRRGVEVQGIVWRCHGGKPLFVFRDSPGGAMGRGRFAVRPC